jgi:hypothetical protein
MTNNYGNIFSNIQYFKILSFSSLYIDILIILDWTTIYKFGGTMEIDMVGNKNSYNTYTGIVKEIGECHMLVTKERRIDCKVCEGYGNELMFRVLPDFVIHYGQHKIPRDGFKDFTGTNLIGNYVVVTFNHVSFPYEIRMI